MRMATSVLPENYKQCPAYAWLAHSPIVALTLWTIKNPCSYISEQNNLAVFKQIFIEQNLFGVKNYFQ